MLEQIKEKINLGTWQRIVAFCLLFGLVYSIIWGATEPLNLDITTTNKPLWRLILISGTLIITSIIYFRLLFAKYLEKFGLDYNDTNLQTTVRSSGTPIITTTSDGFHGKVFNLKADFNKDEMTWDLKASAHSAMTVTFIYLPNSDLTFYLRLSVISRDKSSTKMKWLRLEPTFSLPQSVNDDEEMGFPLKATNNHSFLQATINIKDAIRQAWGRHGWQYDKVLMVRARGNGKVKSIIFK
jgi:hypothetical protein